MGIKFRGVQLIPGCFQYLMMGTQLSCIHNLQTEEEAAAEIKLIKWDGRVMTYGEYDQPIYASQLMAEFPKHLVCRSDSFYIGQKIPPLSEEDQLQLGHTYFLLPNQCFQSVLSFVTIASFLNSFSQYHPHPSSTDHLSSSRNGFLKKVAVCQRPFDIQKSASGCLRIRVSDEFIAQLMEEGKLDSSTDDQVDQDDSSASSTTTTGKCTNKLPTTSTRSRVLCNSPQLHRDYTQLVSARVRQWKPKLETIRETDKKFRKLSSFGIKRSKEEISL